MLSAGPTALRLRPGITTQYPCQGTGRLRGASDDYMACSRWNVRCCPNPASQAEPPLLWACDILSTGRRASQISQNYDTRVLLSKSEGSDPAVLRGRAAGMGTSHSVIHPELTSATDRPGMGSLLRRS